MPEPNHSRSPLERFLLMLMLCLAVAAFGAAYDQPMAWGFGLPCILSVFWQIKRVPGWLRVGVRSAAHLFEVLAVGLGFIFMAYPILSAQTSTRLSLIAGYGLCAFSSLFLLGMAAWPASSALWPAILGLLVVDCFNPDARIRPLLVGPGLAALAYLALPGLGRELRKVSTARWMRLAGFALVAALVATSLIVVTPQIQTQTEKMRFQFAQSQMTGYSGLSNSTRMGDLAELQLSEKVVMRLWTDRPQDLRARAYMHFDGRGWTAVPRQAESFVMLPANTQADPQSQQWLASIPGNLFAAPGEISNTTPGSLVRTRILQTLFNNGMMVAPGGTMWVRADLPRLRLDSEGTLLPPASGGVEFYGVLNRRDSEIAQTGNASPEDLSEALQVPKDTDPRIRDLAVRLASGATTPEEKIDRTIHYLQRQYQYTLKVGNFHSSQPVAEFLFEKKKGYCQYFASAAAVLLRLEGVPARYVTGFHVTENNRSGDHYVVRELDAHAWIEAYVSGKGWMQADPTPASEYDSLHAGLSRGWLANTWESLRARAAVFTAKIGGLNWHSAASWLWLRIRRAIAWLFLSRSGLGLCSLALLGWLGRYLYRRRKNSRKTGGLKSLPFHHDQKESAPEVALLLKQLDAYWNRFGAARPAHRAPLEHLETMPLNLVPAEMQKLSRDVIETYYRASFGGMKPSSDEIQRLQTELEESPIKQE